MKKASRLVVPVAFLVGYPIAVWVAGWTAVLLVIIGGMVTTLVSQIRLQARCGRILLRLGSPGRFSSLVGAVGFAAFGVWALDDAWRSGTVPADHWGIGVLCALATVSLLVRFRRGLSLREHGLLTPDWSIQWHQLQSWACDDADSSLSFGVRGGGIIATLLSSNPAVDRTRTWVVPKEALAAARTILREKAPAAEAPSDDVTA